MRFLENGPAIPDELLNARDEGRVVFFCGAGVSLYRAGLPDFFGLAEKVISELGASDGSDAAKIHKKARELGEETRVPGLISADRIFGLLERDFNVTDIQAAVARSLVSTTDPPDLSAHQILLRLSRTPESNIQLVTTNFDLLFNNCEGTREPYLPPRLPFLSKYDDFNGVVYLHGCVNDSYSNASASGFVLSSAEFGDAYLSEGWATQFFREIVRRYVVVFVGYSADDPPIYYLLEGLRRTKDPTRRIYAFQRGTRDEAVALWESKGVEAINYGEMNGYDDLWNTLEAWAMLADNPDVWRSKVIERSLKGPRVLKPHERGQVAHVVSTYRGAREFCERKSSELTPPAEWLCVFDRQRRFARPERSSRFESEAVVVDPFTLYGIDSDIVPERVDPENPYVKREIPHDAWDAFARNTEDDQDRTPESVPVFRGPRATCMPRLPRRLACLSNWIMNVAHEPAALWWAVRQDSLHPSIRNGIAWRLRTDHDLFSPVTRTAWRYLLEYWQPATDRNWHDLQRQIERDGWDTSTLREFLNVFRPVLKIRSGFLSRPLPPKSDEEIRLHELVHCEVEWPDLPPVNIIPDGWLAQVLRGLRQNIECGVQLSVEIDDSAPSHLAPIIADNSPDINVFQRTQDVSGYVLGFVALFERLLAFDFQAAVREAASWLVDDQSVFARLRIWLAGDPRLTSPEALIQVIESLDNDTFWDSYHQRDLLITLEKRWADLSVDSRKLIEERILQGRDKWEGQSEESYAEDKAWHILNRLQWLIDQGCRLPFDPTAKTAELRKLAPNWKPEYAVHATDSSESRGGFVSTDLKHDALLREPIDSILAKALELAGRDTNNILKEHDPFAGLCAEHPRRAYLALVHSARRNEYPKWAWEGFLNSQARKEDAPQFSATIAARLCKTPDQIISTFIYSCTYWLHNVHESLSAKHPGAFDRVTSCLIDIVALQPSEAHSAIISSGTGRDWSTSALNSPAGHIARAILEDSRVKGADGEVKITPEWLARLERLLQLSGDPRRHAVNMMSHQIAWLHYHEPEWTEQHLVSIADAGDELDQEAFWAGFLWNPRVGSERLFLQLKPHLLRFAAERTATRKGHIQSLAYVILQGWLWRKPDSTERQLADSEFRDALLNGGNEFRSHIVWKIRRGLENQQDQELWENNAIALFSDVWPRQKDVKNAEMSLRLVELLLSNVNTFVKLIDCVLPLLTRIDQSQNLYLERGNITEIASTHPVQVLAVLSIILPEEITNWPYGIGSVLEGIGEADKTLRANAQYRELMRIWNTR